MDEGIIYEDGTPKQIFDDPKKEKTRLFIKQLKPFHYDIPSKAFDFLGINSAIVKFIQNHMISNRICYQCQSLFEELFMQCILLHLPECFDAALDLGWSERNGTMDFCLRYDGDAYDPLTDPENDEVALLLIHKVAPGLTHRYADHMNYLEVTLQAESLDE